MNPKLTKLISEVDDACARTQSHCGELRWSSRVEEHLFWVAAYLSQAKSALDRALSLAANLKENGIELDEESGDAAEGGAT